MCGMATGSTADTSGAYNDGFYTYYIRQYPPMEPDDDIISPLWEFIKTDNSKQNRAARHVTNVKRSRPVHTRRKLMSSRSGYRGIKTLKRL